MSEQPIKTHWKMLVDPRFIGVYALPNGEDLTVTILYAQKEQITMMGGKKENHLLLYLGGHQPLILNKTNADMIETLYGPYIEDWAGKRITLYASTTKMGGDVVACLRIRKKVPVEAKPTLTDARLEKALAAVKSGEFSAATLRAKYALTEAQGARLAALDEVAQ